MLEVRVECSAGGGVEGAGWWEQEERRARHGRASRKRMGEDGDVPVEQGPDREGFI